MSFLWVARMFLHQNELREFKRALDAIAPIMTDPQETRYYKRETLNMMVDELTEGTFKLQSVAEQITTIINMKEDVCKEYADSTLQTDGILEWLPRMKDHRDVLLKEVKKHRGKYQLTV